MFATIVFCLLSSRLLCKNLKIKVYKNNNFTYVLDACETWSLTLWEEHRLRVLNNRVLRRIFGPKREEVAGDWIRLRNVELHNLYASPNINKLITSRRMRLAGHVARMGKMRNIYKVFVRESEGGDHLEDLDVDGVVAVVVVVVVVVVIIVIEWIFDK
jgi:hypothetical protein